MRKGEREIKSGKIIREILVNSEICRIAMVDKDQPYIVPLNYGYSDNTIYMHSAPEGRKIDILKLNDHVCFEIEYRSEIIKKEIACNWSAKYRSIIGYGKIEIVTNTELKKQGLDIIMSKYGRKGNIEYNASSLDKMVLLKLEIESVSGKQSGEWN